MRRDAAAWLLSVPLALAGCLAAHALAYRLVVPDAHERAHLLAETGHGYLGHLRLLVAAAVALVLVCFVRQALLAARGVEAPGPSRLVALVPPLAFLLQEHLERALHGHALPLDALTQPGVLVGLALQLPFALLALALASLLARSARALGRLLARGRVPAATPRLRPAAFAVPRSARRPLRRGRGPPAPVRP